jgi:hypothetical protein
VFASRQFPETLAHRPRARSAGVAAGVAIRGAVRSSVRGTVATAALAALVTVAACSAGSTAAPQTVTVTAVSVSTVTNAAAPVTVTQTVTAAEPVDSSAGATDVEETLDVSGQPAACDLVTQAEADALAGTPLEAPHVGRESCTYTGPVTGPLGQVEVYVRDGAKKFLDIERTLKHELRPLDGVADESYLGASNSFIRKGSTWVAIQLVRLNDPAENAGPLEALTRTVAGRLP